MKWSRCMVSGGKCSLMNRSLKIEMDGCQKKMAGVV